MFIVGINVTKRNHEVTVIALPDSAEVYIPKRPVTAVLMIKKSSFMARQGNREPSTFEAVSALTSDEIARSKNETFCVWRNEAHICQQVAVCTFIPNAGLRTWKVPVLLSSGIIWAP